MAVLGKARTLGRCGWVEQSEINWGVPLKEILGPSDFSSLCFLDSVSHLVPYRLPLCAALQAQTPWCQVAVS